MSYKNLIEKDKKYLWHPLTQHKLHSENLPIIKAKGNFLYDAKGKKYIDGIASWYCAMYGHCNGFITKKIKTQLKKLDQIVFSGFTHPPAVKMGEKLMAILPKNQQKIFFSDNGSTAVEIALKMAFQFFFNQNQKRNKIVAFEESFHGDTFGAMSVSGLSIYNGAFKDFFIEVIRIPVPDENNFEKVKKDFKELLKEKNVAAFIFEPLVQGAAGMKMHKAIFLDALLEICKKYKTLTIADEVMTGFGKTGKHFASLYLKNAPDMICLSKALTVGLVPMGLTCCTKNIFEAFYDKELSKGFFHGHTYSANPMACTAALSGMKLLLSKKIQENIVKITEKHKIFGKKLEPYTIVKNIRQTGVIFAFDLDIQMKRYGNLRNQLFDFFMKKGVFLRPLGNTIYILAPFTILKKELEQIYNVIESVLTSNFLKK